MIRAVSIFFLLATTTVWAQEKNVSKLNGKIMSTVSNLEGIYIINLKTEKAAISDRDGYFSLPAAVGDTLLLSAVQFKGLRICLTPKSFEGDLFYVKMTPIMNQLNEVIIKRYATINAEALGIIPKGQKSYTPAERKLKAATGMDAKYGLSTSFSIDPLLNLLSGRTAMLKKELAVEKKEQHMQQIENLFDMDFFTKKLKIPSEYVKGFEYYAVENEKFIVILESNNKTSTEFLIGELATKYKDLLASEK
ncbi:hypothetical protein [Flavobacterium restrictum]|uniref:CarboxypepD_reg-like domain-containing protein n=1 Tax=Flavobacterium restrictum TaxID=2594428 RepID=A0A553E3Z7_9FLAO|nr:hypothetical protein [Flavobacterium restrictum]TRX39662.1 hypothetical protein FNW21_08105 [Flavobacterium restrictum]